MTKKILFLLFVVVVTALVYTIYRLKTPVSLGTIESTVSSENASDNEISTQLTNLFQFIEKYQLSKIEAAKIDSSIAENPFLTKRDSSLVKKILVLNKADSVQEDSLFFINNRISLNRLFFNILNQDVYLKHHFSNKKLPEEKNIESVIWISKQFDRYLNINYYQSQIEFYLDLEPQQLKTKLELELIYSKMYNLLISNPKGALNYIGTCLKKAKKIGDDKRELEALARLQYVLYESFGLTSTAIAFGKYLIEESSNFEHSLNCARVHYYSGNALIDKGHFGEALTEFELALQMYMKFSYDAMIVRLYERMGIVNRRLGRFDKALEFYNKSFEFEKQSGESSARMYYLLGIGLVQWEMGLYSEAEKSYKEGLEIARSVKDKHNEAIALMNLGVLYNDLGDYNKAVEYLLNTLKILEDEQVPHTIAQTLMFLTEVYVMNNQLNEAKESAADAVKQLSKYDFGMLNANNYLHLGQLQLQIGDLENALHSFNQGLKLFEEIEVRAGQVESLNLLGEVHLRLRNFEAGLEILEEAINIETQFPQMVHEWNTYFNLANIYKDLNQIQKAESYYRKSISFVKNVATRLINNEQRTNFSQKIQPVFENMVLLQYNMNDKKKALFYAEQERAQVFNILLQDHPDDLPTQVTLKSSTGMNLPNTNAYNPRFLSDLQANLDTKTVTIEYEITDSSLVIWVIGHEAFEAVKVNINRATLDKWIAEFRECTNLENLKPDSSINYSYARTRELGKQLYEYLILPVEKYLSNADLVYFIPDETLHYLPFTTLINSKDEYLITEFAIAYIPSATILEQSLQKMKLKKDIELYDKHLLSVASNLDLEHAIQEAIEVASLNSNSDYLVGLDASELALRNKLQTDVNILLFSNHSKIDEKKPYYSALFLGKDSTYTESSENDGLLNVQEIQQLNLNVTELVYLSSCESASGKLYKGEGIVGMQRAFMIAGASCVIANLWKIEDKSAKVLTIAFFKLWLSGKFSKAEALRQAQLKMIKRMNDNPMYNNRSHPFFWASVKLTGSYN